MELLKWLKDGSKVEEINMLTHYFSNLFFLNHFFQSLVFLSSYYRISASFT